MEKGKALMPKESLKFSPKQDWVECKLEEVCEMSGGGTPSRERKDFFSGTIPWVTPTEIDKNKIVCFRKTREYITNEGLKNSSAKILPKGTVLFTSRASIGFISISDIELCTNQGFINFVCNKSLYNWYFAYWLKSQKRELYKLSSGSTFKEISKSAVRNIPISLPPLPEQRAIVAKIETLLSDLDNGIENLEKAKSQLRIYKQAVLKKAFSGELVSNVQTTNDKTAKELHVEIQNEWI